MQTFSHHTTPPKWQVIFSLYFALNSNETRFDKRKQKLQPWVRSTQQENKINQQHSASPPEGTKLKALHHSVLVKAEFFMKRVLLVLL